MKKKDKLSLLNGIKSSEETNNSSYALNFPVRHKSKRAAANITIHYQDKNLRSVIGIEKIIISTYKHIEKIINRVSMEKALKRQYK